MSTDRVRVTPEWALWGKDPHERDFRLLRCSGVRLGRHDFSEIISRYSPGTHTDLPQVALSWTRLGEEIYLGIAIQEWSNEGDRLGRDIAVTRYFGVPYFQLERPISYLDLYEALADRDATAGEPISVPALDPHRIAARVGPDALGTAALLLTRSPVQMDGAEGVRMEERLGFLDAVAALLPYAMRTRFSAATWVSSTSEHNFRLAFSSHVRDGALPVTWGSAPAMPPEEQLAHAYRDVLAGQADLPHVIEELARLERPMGFEHVHIRAALRRLQDIAASPAQRPAPAVNADADPAAVLHALAEARRGGDREAVEQCVELLERLRTRPCTADRKRRHREIVKEHGLLDASDMLEPRRQIQLYQALLPLAYAGVLTVAHLEQIEEDAGMIHGLLLRTLENYPGADTVVNLLVAVRCAEDGRRKILNRLDSKALVEAAAREPLRVKLFDLVFHELVRRLDEEEDPAVAPLWQHAYLAHPLRRRFPNDERTQFEWLTRLLAAAYGERLGVKEFEEVVDGSRTPRPTTALFGAALFLYGTAPNPRELLLAAYFGRMVEASTLGPEVTAYLDAVLGGGPLEAKRPPPSPPHPRVLARLAQKIRLGRAASLVPRLRGPAHPDGAQVPPSFGAKSGPGGQTGEPAPEGGDTGYDGRRPWTAFTAVVVFLLVLTLLLMVTAPWWWSPEPPPP